MMTKIILLALAISASASAFPSNSTSRVDFVNMCTGTGGGSSPSCCYTDADNDGVFEGDNDSEYWFMPMAGNTITTQKFICDTNDITSGTRYSAK